MYINSEFKEIQYIKGVGPKTAKNLARLNIYNTYDAILHYPKRYEDRTKFTSVDELKADDFVQVVGRVESKIKNLRIKKNFSVQKTSINVSGSIIDVVWYNNPYVEKTLQIGKEYIFYGKLKGAYGRYEIQIPEYTLLEDKSRIGFLPVYDLTKNISQNYLRKIIKQCIEEEIYKFKENLNTEIISKNNLIDFQNAIKNIHFPVNEVELEKASYRLKYEEFFFMQLALMYIKRKSTIAKGIKFDKTVNLETLLQKLPFKLTNAQLKVLEEIESDLESDKKMERLLQGDVGSRKNSYCNTYCI